MMCSTQYTLITITLFYNGRNLRIKAPYKNVSKEKGLFEIQQRTYAQQYSQIYFVRLAALLPALQIQAHQKWSGKTMFSERIIDVQAASKTCIFGTVYVEMEEKPNVLKDLSFDLNIVKSEVRDRYTGGKMEYFLEDDSARIQLAFPAEGLTPSRLFVTGVSVAVLGHENEKGIFEVADYCFAGTQDEEGRQEAKPSVDSSVALVSGVSFGPEKADNFTLLMDYLAGNIPVATEQASKISRLILVGNTLSMPARIDEAAKKKYGVEHARYDFSSIGLLDKRLAALSSSIPIDLMPGEQEPTTSTMPQSPIHRGILPLASKQETFQAVMNPYAFEVDGLRFLGTSGQNLDDVWRYSDVEDRLDIAEMMLKWRNIAPTAPDTLWCFPFFDRDPFILDRLPDVFFIGNQPEFKTRTVDCGNGRKTLIVLLPKHSETSQLVLVNTLNLSCEALTIKSTI